MSRLEVLEIQWYRVQIQEEYLSMTCGKCARHPLPSGTWDGGECEGEPCPGCLSRVRMDWGLLDQLRNESMDRYIEHRAQMTRFTRERMAQLGFRYTQSASAVMPSGPPRDPQGD